MFKLGFLFQFTEENMMIFVPLSGFDIARALLLKYCISLYFSFLGEILLIKKQSQSQSQFKKMNIYFCFLFLLLYSYFFYLSYY